MQDVFKQNWLNQLAEQARSRAEQQAHERRTVYEFVDVPVSSNLNSNLSTESFIEMYGMAVEAAAIKATKVTPSIPNIKLRSNVCLTPQQVFARLA